MPNDSISSTNPPEDSLAELTRGNPHRAYLAVIARGQALPTPELLAVPENDLLVGRKSPDALGRRIAGKDSAVARRHFVIGLRQGAYHLFACGGRIRTGAHGIAVRTYVNAGPLFAHEGYRLQDGDLIHFGDTLAIFRAAPMPEPVDDPELLPGVAPSVLAARRVLLRAAPSKTTILLLGPTGTGKSAVAWAIHARSERRNRRIVAVKASNIPPEQARVELEGNSPGAYTGAERRMGYIAEAERGTLFLDEIGRAPRAVQNVLIGYLDSGRPDQPRTYRPLGAQHPKDSDVRVIAATDADINGPDLQVPLVGRLARGVVVSIPSLEERREDIPMWVRRIADGRFARHALSVSCLEALMVARWPLNLRGLEGALTHASHQTGALRLKLRHLPTRFTEHLAQARERYHVPTPMPGTAPPPSMTTDDKQLYDELLAALLKTGGNVSEAERRQILPWANREELYRWRKRIGLRNGHVAERLRMPIEEGARGPEVADHA